MTKRVVLFDLDGTLYLGGKLLPGARALLSKMQSVGIEHGYMTNNSSIAPCQYVKKLDKLGLPAEPSRIITSCEATVRMLDHLALGRGLFVVGTTFFRDYIEDNGYHHTEDNPSAVLIGFDLELTHRRLMVATRLVAAGVPLLASHPDVVCPSPDGPIPDAGMILAAIKAGTGVTPVDIAGKPSRWMLEVASQHFGVGLEDITIVGDRLETDMRMGCEHGLKTVLVLSGVTRSDSLGRSPFQPDLVVDSVADLLENHGDSWFWDGV